MAIAISTIKTNSAFHKYWVILSTRTQEDMAYRANYVFGAIFFLLRPYFSHAPLHLECGAFAVSLFAAFSIGMLFCSLIGMLAFWFLEISTFLFVVMMIEFFLSGQMIPLNILPTSMQPFLTFSPFGYEGYWPCMILMGKVPQAQLPQLLGIGFLWVGVFYFISGAIWKQGLKRYSPVGG